MSSAEAAVGPTRAAADRGLGTAVDLALFGVSAAVAVSLVRAFRTWDELWALLAVVATAHALSWILRRLQVRAVVATPVLLAVGAIVVTLVYYRSQSWFGLPTPDVARQLLDDARAAFGPFEQLVPPVRPLRGFTATFAIGLWLMAVFADLAAGRSDAPMQAVATQVATFVFSCILLRGRHAVLATVVFVSAMVVYRLAVRAARLHRAAGTRPGQRVVWAVGLPMLAVILLAGLTTSRAVPTDDDGLVDLRAIGRGPDARVVESPLVSLDSLLGGESNELLFTVASPTPHYWRLTALDTFDGVKWSANAKYSDLDSGERIGSVWQRGVEVRSERLSFEINGLDSAWLPSAYAPREVTSPIDLRYDPSSGSVFVSEDESTASVDYSMVSDIADLDPDVLRQAPSPVDPAMGVYRALPGDFPPGVRDLAQQLTEGRSAYDAAVALEEFFQSERFSYRRDVDYRGSDDPLSAFIEAGAGFCQQFSTAFAAMARSIGLPARVAVGFTYGDAREVTDSETGEVSTVWDVRGRYAHAWPEVHISGVGWIAFEPTKGRGNPDASSYSTAPPAQADATGGSVALGATTTTTTTTTVAPGGAVPTTLPDQEPQRPEITAAGAAETSGGLGGATWVLLAIVAGAAAVLLTARLRVGLVRRRRVRLRRPEVSPADRVAESWRQVCRDLERVDVHGDPSETPIEFARRAARVVEVERLVALGRHESDRRFRAGAPADDEAEDAERISDEVREVVWSRLDRRQRIAADLDVT